jgi:hypothetical protein
MIQAYSEGLAIATVDRLEACVPGDHEVGGFQRLGVPFDLTAVVSVLAPLLYFLSFVYRFPSAFFNCIYI